MADSQRKTAQIFNLSDASQMTSFNCTPTIYQGTLTQVNHGVYARTEWDINKFQPNVKYTISAQFNNAGASSVNIRILDSDGSTVIANTDTTTNTSGILQVTFVARNAKQYIRFYSNTLNTGNTSTVVFSDIMLNEGKTALPYEPYGWLHSLRKLTTATEAVENPLYSDGTAITAYTIKGNEEHTSTPTPSNPVDVQGVGVRTAQLYNSADTIWILGILDDNGQNTGATTSHYTGNFTEVKANKSYTISGTLGAGSNQYRIYFYDAEKRWVSRTPPKLIAENSFTTPVNCKYIQIQVAIAAENTTDWMLNEGSTAKPYEPYGYKIPILSGGVTTNIYLGSTQTTRQIKKLVLTGEESITSEHLDVSLFVVPVTDYLRDLGTTIIVCTHYKSQKNASGWAEPQPNTCTFYAGTVQLKFLYIRDGNCATVKEFKTFLATQYSNGTPVTIWYVLETPETAAINEPLMKIGDYADTLSNATAIPTTEGANSITVDTTVQPSEFTATWTGWHNASVKEWDGSDWN